MIKKKINEIQNAKKDGLHGLAQLLMRWLRAYIYRVIWMQQYSVIARKCKAPNGSFPYSMEFWSSDKFSQAMEINPYLNQQDIEEFRKCESICIITKDKDKIIGNDWMVSGKHCIRELGHTMTIRKNEFFLCRGFVHPDYRGKRVSGNMIYLFAREYASPDTKIFTLVFDWNTSSKKSLYPLGWKYERNVGFTTFFGFKLCRYRIRKCKT